ncbi:uncharacterized protein BX664DRAFT_261276 [Halteromyces radiatus]|uniref:uncharacterized protein n=1 Tax=Halteromyces radiatus TaxID=101107 RepID=UPI002220EADC|nr:uncharacterized protein BX664DRAFT_261276 [Halteromyces radiatus]KAI8093261.1 hypothetical protein BX664DRAFT_261276 [Halteromyces radiatus]
MDQLIKEWGSKVASQQLVTHDTITASPLNLLANALDEPTVAYKYEQLPSDGTIVPATWHHIYFPPRTVTLAHDGYETDFFPPAPFTQRMWAGATLTWYTPLSVGDEVTMVTSMDRYEFRPASRLGDAVFVYLNKDIYRGDQKMIREQRCLVYATEQTHQVSMKSIKMKKLPDVSKQIIPSSIQLFQYSALTFNAHRIHYDQDYTKNMEHHPACLVHGPLSSTWMISLLRTYLASEYHVDLDSVIQSFDYRCLTPLYVNQPLTICGKQISNRHFELWILGPTQQLAVKGTVTLNIMENTKD